MTVSAGLFLLPMFVNLDGFYFFFVFNLHYWCDKLWVFWQSIFDI